MSTGETRISLCLYGVLIVATVAASAVHFAGRATAANGNANLYLGKTVSAATLTPALSLTLGVDKSSAIPGDTLTYTAAVTNTGGVVSLAGDLTAYNQSGVVGQIASYWDAFATSTNDPCAPGSTQGNNASGWTAFAGTALAQVGYTPVDPAPLSTGLQLSVYPVTSTGVAYPSSGDQILGTRVAAGATARWHYTAKISVTLAQEAVLVDRTKVTEERNTFHTEITPRVQSGSGQPNTVNTVFCDLLQPAVSATIKNASVALTPPQGDPSVTFTGSTTPGLASMAPGATVIATYAWRVHVPAEKGTGESDSAYTARLQALEGAQLLATATASGTSYGGAVTAGPVLASTTEHVPILSIAKGGPAVAPAGSTATYPVNLANSGGATAVALNITDAVPSGSSAAVTGAPSTLAPSATGSATASFLVPVSQPCGPLSDTAAVTWQDSNADAYGPVSSSYTTTVTNCFAGSSLTLSPTVAGPDVTGTSQTLEATFLGTTSQPISGQSIAFNVTGANPTSGTATTDQNGVASFSYLGNGKGTDTAQASFASGAFSIQSNTATINWVTPVATVSTTTIHGTFFPGGCGSFCHAPGSTPAFSQDFPTIDFNPPGGTIPGNNTGVTVDTRPFTDITTDVGGNFSGSVVAQGNGVQAGTGNLFTFDAVFNAEYVVATPGNVTFNFYSDDGFIFGVGGGATRVSGPMVNAPSTTPFQSYPVMGAYNQPTSPVANSITVNFPSAGSYPYEADYSECCGGQAAFTMASSSTGHGVPPAGNLTLTPQNAPTQAVGQAATLTASAMDASGQPVGSLPVTLTVTGPNAQQLSATTNAQGLATFIYVGSAAGTDQDEIGANLSGMPAISNIAEVPWAFSVPGQSSGNSTAPPPSITAVAPPEGTVVTKPTAITGTVAPPPGQSIASWTVTYQALDPGPVVTLASGSGAPPSPIATFDPTLLPNDTYAITVTATASGGGTESTTTTVAVSGNLKLGRYTTTLQDLVVPVNGMQLEVQRTYDSTDKRAGDFGVGWRVSIANFRTAANRVLGAGGWTEYTTSCFILCNHAFRTSTPHYVTVTFPDNHQEVFDFTPNGPGLTLVDFAQGTAAFTAKAGTSSTLAVGNTGDQGFTYGFDGNLYSGGQLYNPTRFKLTTRDGRSYVLDVNFGLVSETDPNGNALFVDSAGVHSTNGSLSFTRDGLSRITDVNGPVSTEHLHYTYSPAGDLQSVTDPDGNVDTYSYTGDHLLTGWTDPSGTAIETITYGSDGRVNGVGSGAQQPVTINNDVGAQQQTTFDPNGKLTTVYSYDPLGDLLEKDETAGGELLRTRYGYDAIGRVSSVIDPLNRQVTITYDETSTSGNGNVLQYTDANNRTWKFSNYNAYGEVGTIVAPDGSVYLSVLYDANGNPLSRQRPGQAATTYTYYATGLVQSLTDPGGRSVNYTYDSAGHLTSVLDSMGHGAHYIPDAAGHVLQVTDQNGHSTSYTYDGLDNVTAITDDNRHTWVYHYNNRDLLDRVTDPTGALIQYTYNDLNQLEQRVDRNNQTTTYGYDVDGRRVLETLPGNQAVHYAYDGFERLVEADNQTEQLEYILDGAGEVTRQTSCAPQPPGQSCVSAAGSSQLPTVSLNYTYWPDGAEHTVTGPDGTTAYSYDGIGRLQSVADAAGNTPFTLGYDGIGQLQTISRPNGVQDQFTFNASGDLTSRDAVLGTVVLARADYGIDAVTGRRTSLTNTTGTTGYGFDLGGELQSVAQPAGSTLSNETYTNDGAGNRTSSVSVPLGGIAYDNANRLQADGSFTYSWDAEGDLRGRTPLGGGAGQSFDWNADHQLTAAHLANGATVTYGYDPFGRRVSVGDGTTSTRSVWDGANVRLDYDGSNNLVASYTTTAIPGSLLEIRSSGQSVYPVQDADNSVSVITDANGAVIARYNYGAFGQPDSANPTSTRFTCGGWQYDAATGLYYARERYYDSGSGRFISEDPLLSVNPYPYAANDPVDFIDPSGAQGVVDEAVTDENAAVEGQGARNLGSRICERIAQCVTKIDNIKEHLTPSDLDAARREAAGEVVASKADGTPWDHVQEVRDAQAGLLNTIKTLTGILCDPSATVEEREAAQTAFGDASRMLDKSEGYLPR